MSNHEHPCKWCGEDMRQMGNFDHESQCDKNPSRPTPKEIVPTCPCQFCDTKTTMTATRMCDNCNEVHRRIGPEMHIRTLNKIVKSARSRR